jgi:hypothetical protein
MKERKNNENESRSQVRKKEKKKMKRPQTSHLHHYTYLSLMLLGLHIILYLSLMLLGLHIILICLHFINCGGTIWFLSILHTSNVGQKYKEKKTHNQSAFYTWSHNGKMATPPQSRVKLHVKFHTVRLPKYVYWSGQVKRKVVSVRN